MKKKKLTGLKLTKQTISKLQESQIIGGKLKATDAYTCTQNTVYKTNCGDLTICISAGACA